MWRPLHLDNILADYDPLSARVLGSLFLWILTIFGCLWLSMSYLPDDWVSIAGNKNELLRFFMINPSMILGLILLFWLGFEWGFIPVFLSMFVIGFYSHLPYYWSILFAISFVFGLSIYALVYQCLKIRYDLRSIVSFAVFIITSFVAATASSLGSFIWSFAHDLSASETAVIWNAWWAGSFLQSTLFVGPVLILLSPSVERFKERYFEIPERKEVSTTWVYGAVITVTLIIAIFIYSGDYLAKSRLTEELASMSALTQSNIMNSLESSEIITWVSIWIILCVGLGGIFLIGSWNHELQKQVDERTAKLEEAEKGLKASLEEKVVLLKEIHHRVKNNLAVVTALLDLQYMRAENENIRHILSDAKSRVKSMAFVHETLYQTEDFSSIDLKLYLRRLCESIDRAFKPNGKNIDIRLETDGTDLEMSKAIPLGLILNEVLVNSYKHAFSNRSEGRILIDLHSENSSIHMHVKDNGVGIANVSEIENKRTLGMTLIKTLSKQLNADFKFGSENGETEFSLTMNLN